MRNDANVAMSADSFEAMLAEVLAERTAERVQPAGLEQRLLARMMLAAEGSLETHISSRYGAPGVVAAEIPVETHISSRYGAPGVVTGQNAVPRFGFAESVRTRRSRASVWTALLAHAAVLLVVLGAMTTHVRVTKPRYVTKVEQLVVPPPPVAPRKAAMGGGGGQPDLAPATQGRLPKAVEEQIVPPKTPPMQEAKIVVEPAVVVQKDLKMADNTIPNLGVPSSSLKGFSLGNGAGTGLGAGNGSGVGPGSGGNIGGGVMRVGGSVKAPVVISQVEPEYSEEARKAKFDGNVMVSLVVDEHGNPTHVRAIRGVGMGLDEKAVEAVRQYKFKPATQNGKPVAVELYVDVGFQIF